MDQKFVPNEKICSYSIKENGKVEVWDNKEVCAAVTMQSHSKSSSCYGNWGICSNPHQGRILSKIKFEVFIPIFDMGDVFLLFFTF